MKKVLIISSSPRKNSNSEALCLAFADGAREAGHEVEIVSLRDKTINFCRGCFACQKTQKCVINDDASLICGKALTADVLVFASPIYYFNMSAQMEAAIQRVYCIGKPLNAKKVALLLSSGSPGVYDAAIAQINSYCAFTGIDFVGSITANGAENKSEAKMTEIKEFAKAL